VGVRGDGGRAEGIVIAIVAVGLLYLIIGAVVWMGKRRPRP
jgi:hypothetical protein